MRRYFTGLTPQPPFPWLADVWARFTGHCDVKQLPHAILVSSQGGAGELDLAFAFAQYLLCASPQNHLGCGKCKSCQLLAVDAHPDLFSITPEEKSSIIKVEAIRQVAHFISNTAQQGGRKVVLIYPAEAMNVNAANALLKNLEEPSGDTTLILVTERPTQLLATIRSRCHQWSIISPSPSVSIDWLTRNKIDDAQEKLALCGGYPLAVMEWDKDGLFEIANVAVNALQGFLAGDKDAIQTAKALAKMDAIWLVNTLLRWSQSALRERVLIDGEKAIRKADSALYVMLYDQLLLKKRQLQSGSNPNVQLLLEALFLQIKPISL